ncbi:Cro/CI family transcriptional regulator [uncultured Pseudomonas sp.]|uniref:Cro/CI family transcriptional regulator n=1 Tax=uncultured Pseudomonas sp. TaxID=114707 RepID=UPI0025F3DBE6|nr:Cro/CI family transcriptional regulator [uncultured Pseudomonas sp.]
MLTKDAVAFFKGKSKLAAALGISPAAVSQWGEFVPGLRQYQLRALTGGALAVKAEPAARDAA